MGLNPWQSSENDRDIVSDSAVVDNAQRAHIRIARDAVVGFP